MEIELNRSDFEHLRTLIEYPEGMGFGGLEEGMKLVVARFDDLGTIVEMYVGVLVNKRDNTQKGMPILGPSNSCEVVRVDFTNQTVNYVEGTFAIDRRMYRRYDLTPAINSLIKFESS